MQLNVIGEELSTLNPIVQSILSNAAASMGLGVGGRWGQGSITSRGPSLVSLRARTHLFVCGLT